MEISRKARVEFLNECYAHIKRIFNDEKNFRGVESLNRFTAKTGFFALVLENDERYLPYGFNMPIGESTTMGDKKLEVLIRMYNAVADGGSLKPEPVDLEDTFSKVKQDTMHLFTSPEFSIEKSMKSHRASTFFSHQTDNMVSKADSMLKSIYNAIFSPQIVSFLSKYEFFTEETNSPTPHQ